MIPLSGSDDKQNGSGGETEIYGDIRRSLVNIFEYVFNTELIVNLPYF